MLQIDYETAHLRGRSGRFKPENPAETAQVKAALERGATPCLTTRIGERVELQATGFMGKCGTIVDQSVFGFGRTLYVLVDSGSGRALPFTEYQV